MSAIHYPGNENDLYQVKNEVTQAIRKVTGIVVGNFFQVKKWGDHIEELVGLELGHPTLAQFSIEDACQISKKLGREFVVWTKESSSLKYRDGVLFP